MKYNFLLFLTIFIAVFLSACATMNFSKVNPHVLACQGNVDEAKMFFGKPENRSKYRFRYILGAIKCNKVDIVKYLLAEGIVGVNETNGRGGTTLVWASARNDLEIVKYILSNKDVDLSAHDQLNKALMGSAVARNNSSSTNIDIMALLVANGANINYQNEKGESTLRRAVMYGRVEGVKYLVEHGAIINPNDGKLVFLAVRQNKEMTVLYLLDKGVSHNYKNGDQGWDTFSLAISKNMTNVVDKILSKVADKKTKLFMINKALNDSIPPKMKAMLQTNKELLL